MAYTLYELVNRLAVLLAGRNPEWKAQAAPATGAPASASAGVALNGAPRSLVAVDLRGDVSGRGAVITVTALDLTAVYTVTCNGTACNYDAGGAGAADLEDVIQGIESAINTLTGTHGWTATASDADGDGSEDTLTLADSSEAGTALDIAATGSGVLSCVADAETATARVFLSWAGTGAGKPSGWAMVNDGGAYALDYRGWAERFDTAGAGRLYVEIYGITGHASDGGSVTLRDPTVTIGPAIQES